MIQENKKLENSSEYITLKSFVENFDNQFKLARLNVIKFYITCDLIDAKYFSNGNYSVWYITLFEKDNNTNYKIDGFINEFSLKNLNTNINDFVNKKVNIICYPYYQKKYNTLQLRVEKIELAGVSKVKQEYERVFNHFKSIGAFLDINKKKLPKKGTVKTIAIITKYKSEAYYDMLKSIKTRDPFVNVLEYHCNVQGQNASFSIKEMIEKCNVDNKADVIILGRGGGSELDLAAYNTFDVVDAIYNSNIPIITTIGHTSDRLISDYVSSLSAEVPAKGCEYILNSFLETKTIFKNVINEFEFNYNNYISYIKNKQAKILNYILTLNPESKFINTKTNFNKIVNDLEIINKNYYLNKKQILNNYDDFIKNYQINKTIIENKKELLNLSSIIDGIINNILYKKSNIMKDFYNTLELLDFNKIIKRGFSITFKEDKIIKSINEVKKDDIIKIKVSDGSIKAKVIE